MDRQALDYPQGRQARPAAFRGVAAAALLGLLLAGCASAPRAPAPAPVPAPRPAAPPDALLRANDVLMRAIGLVGTPYRYGGNTPAGGFDCSGLIGFVFRDAAGLALPRTTRDLAGLPVPKVSRQQLRPGDLVFFGQRHGVDHAGIYVGDGRFVHAPSTGGTVRLDALDSPYWSSRWLLARRVL